MSTELHDLLAIANQVIYERSSGVVRGYCGIAASLLEALGVGRLAYGQVWLSWELKQPGYTVAQHCWNVTENGIIDITAEQFTGPKVYSGPFTINPFWGEYIETAGTDFGEWPVWQRPTPELIAELKAEVLRRLELGNPQINHSLWS